MAEHLVGRKSGKHIYYSVEQSYREGGKVKKRVIRYYGRNKPPSILDVNWAATFQSEPGAAAAERAMEKIGERPVVEEPSKLPEGLQQGPREPVEVEKPPSTIDYGPFQNVREEAQSVSEPPATSEPAEPPASEPSPDASSETTPSADAGSDDASGSENS